MFGSGIPELTNHSYCGSGRECDNNEDYTLPSNGNDTTKYPRLAFLLLNQKFYALSHPNPSKNA